MKFQYLLGVIMLGALIACGETTENPTTFQKTESKQLSQQAPDFRHVITESTNDYPMALRSDKDMTVYPRMILDIDLAEDGSFTIRGEEANWDVLKTEMDLFFNANRNLGKVKSAELKKDESYEFNNYPFFNYFNKDSYQSFIDRLVVMAETDMKAGLYLQRHIRRIKAFKIDSLAQLGFINLGALVRYSHPEGIEESKIAELENHLAQNLCDMRDAMAQKLFGKTYEGIRTKSTVDARAQQELLFLQEMYPAYLERVELKEKDISTPLDVLP